MVVDPGASPPDPHAFGGTGFFHMPRHHSHFGSPPKKHAMRPPSTRDATKPNTKCVSIPSPLSARHGRLTSRRRIWHASRTKRSVSNIIGSVPNGKRRWGGVRYSFIPLDHPHPTRAGCPSASRPKIFGHFSPGRTFFLRCIMRKYR